MLAINPQYIVDDKKTKQAVIVQIKQWREIIKELEMLDDLKAYDEAKKNLNINETVSFDEAVKEIRSKQNLKYFLKIQKNAKKSLLKISEPFQSKIIDKIYNLENNPYLDTKKLIGREAYRIRIGNYRVIYEINDNELIIIVVSIGHRKDVYTK